MLRRLAIAAVLLGAAFGSAQAQYYQQQPGGYAPPPPDGYAPQQPGGYSPQQPGGYPQTGSQGYPPPAPEGALQPSPQGYGQAPYPPPPPYGQQPGYATPAYGPPGGRCDAYFETVYQGSRRRVCPMGVAKPVGAPCTCPPRFPNGPYAQGQVIP